MASPHAACIEEAAKAPGELAGDHTTRLRDVWHGHETSRLNMVLYG